MCDLLSGAFRVGIPYEQIHKETTRTFRSVPDFTPIPFFVINRYSWCGWEAWSLICCYVEDIFAVRSMAARCLNDSMCSETVQVSCIICQEICLNAASLNCGHRFCRSCLDHKSQLHDEFSQNETICCPVCHQPSSRTDKLYTSTTDCEVLNLSPKEISVPMTVQSLKPVNCDVCKYKRHDICASDHCPVCAINLCELCKCDHDRHEPFQAHMAVPVTQCDRSALRCEAHEAEYVRYYCSSCIAPLCAVCAVTEHVGHQTSDLAVALCGKQDSIDIAINKVTEYVTQYEELLARLEDVCSIRDAAMKKTRAEIDRHTAGIIEAVHARRQELLDEVDAHHKCSQKVIDIERESYTTQLVSMKSLWKFAAKLTEPGQSLQLLAMYGDVKKMIDAVTNAPEPQLPCEATQIPMFVPKQQLTLGDLKTCEISMDLVRRVTNATSDSGIVSPRASSPVCQGVKHNSTSVHWQTPRLLWKADKTGHRPGEINEAYDVAVATDGTVIIAEWLNQRLQVFDFTGYSRDVVGQGHIQPWGIALTPDGLAIVTDEKERTVKVFDYNTGVLLTSWKKLMFGWPRGVAVNTAGHVIVTDAQHNRHSVIIHLPDGQRVHEFGSQGTGNLQFHWPRYVTVDRLHDERIIVSDGSNHCVKVFDSTGQFLLKFGSLGSRDGHLKHPRGVAVDPEGNIIVADQDNNRVSMFTRDGHFIRHILSIHRPWGVAVNSSGALAVTHKQSVCLYKIFDAHFS